MLSQPTTKADYAAGRHPDNLFSHSDQQAEWQSAMALGILLYRMGRSSADAHRDDDEPDFPVITSTAGVKLYVT